MQKHIDVVKIVLHLHLEINWVIESPVVLVVERNNQKIKIL